MFLLANVAGVLVYIVQYESIKNTSNNFWLEASFFSISMNWGLLNISHWNFSFEYYNMVRIIPFVLDEIPLPENIIR